MGTQIDVWLEHEDGLTASFALKEAERQFSDTEARLSRFRADSELSQLNRSAGASFHASPLLFDLTQQALEWRVRTGGIFDPTILNALVATGYDRSFELIQPSSEEQKAVVETHVSTGRPGGVTLNAFDQTITLAPSTTADLGGIAKGWTSQQAVRYLHEFGPALVDAGGDIACSATPSGLTSWPAALADPFHPESNICDVSLNDEAVATSSRAHRKWMHNGKAAHHLIDPRQNAPAETDLISVTVVAPSLPEAEIHAKVALILGPSSLSEK